MSTVLQDLPRETRLATRWRGPMLRLSLATLAFATSTGWLLLFFGAYLNHADPVATLHWIVAAVAVPVWGVYLLRHYLRVRPGARPFHFYVGVATFFTLLVTALTGVPLIFPKFLPPLQWITDLVHTYASFIVLFLLTAHLMLVTRIAGATAGAPVIRGAVRTTLLWVTLAGSLAAAVAGIWLAL